MSKESPAEVTQLLRAWGEGDREALDRLVPLVHAELHRLAHNYMRREQGRHTLQTSALVNEAYLRLVDVKGVGWQDRARLLAVSAQDNPADPGGFRTLAAEPQAWRRGAEGLFRRSTGGLAGARSRPPGARRGAREARLNARQSQVVELRYFGGLSEDEVAEVLKSHRGRCAPTGAWRVPGSTGNWGGE